MSRFWDRRDLMPLLGVGALLSGGVAIYEATALAHMGFEQCADENAGIRQDARDDLVSSKREATWREAVDRAVRNAIAFAGQATASLMP